MPSLIGNKPNQVPSNGDLGTLAFQDASNPKVGAVVADSLVVDTTTLIVDSVNDRVGIGTSAPAVKMDVNGCIRAIANQTPSSGAGVELVYNPGDSSYVTSYNRTSSSWLNLTLNSATTIFGTSGSERMRIDSSGNLLVGTTSTAPAPQGFTVAIGAGASYINVGHINGTVSGTSYATFSYNTGFIGSISQNGTTAVAYNTSSDYRLKENIAPMQGALDTVAQLKPVTYNWKVDGSSGQGFIAHELQAVVPDCVTGEKDAVDAEGKPVYQGIDTSFLVGILTKAIQELKAELDTVKAELNTLKGN